MYNQLISVDVVPEEWLTAHVTFVCKKGQSGYISNYRPYVPSKILEKIIANIILDHLYFSSISTRIC